MEFAIRPAQSEQASTLTENTIATKRHWNYPERWIQLWLPQLTITPAYILEQETWVAFVDEKQVAYYSFKTNGDDLWLDNLWVLPEFMRRRIGRNLFDHALERARIRGFANLKIEADPNAQSFYKKMGARKIGEHPGWADGQLRILSVMEMVL